MRIKYFLEILLVMLLISSCSVKKMAVNSVAKNMSGSSAAVFMEDNDPTLVGDAFPVILKMMDMMADASPDNSSIKSTAGSMYVMYSNVYLQGKGTMLPYEDWALQKELYGRAKKHYRRGYDYIMDALEIKHKGFRAAFDSADYDTAFAEFGKEDVADLYWGSAAVLAGVSVDMLDPNFAADRDGAIKMLFKALELDPDFGNGMLDELMMQFYASMPEGMGGDMEKALYHYRHGVELSNDSLVSIHVSYASTICTKNQSQEGYDQFCAVLESVLGRDVESIKENRLANIVSQQKAAWLLEHRDDFFLFGF